MKNVIIFFIPLIGVFSKENFLENFLSYMNQDGIVKLEIEFTQKQYNEEFKSKGYFYYLDQNYYIFDNESQRIVYNNNEISTINKVEKQIVYEDNIQNDFTIFDLITGQNDSLFFYDFVILNNKVEMFFKIRTWSISGSIITNYLSGEPELLKLIIDKNLNSTIKVLNVSTQNKFDLDYIESALFSIIDLRE